MGGWLAIPFAGPWLTLGHRESSRSAEEARQDPDLGSRVRWPGDLMLRLVLIADGMVQLGVGTMLLLGYTLHKKKLVRQDLAFFVAPQHVGSGYGLGVAGRF